MALSDETIKEMLRNIELGGTTSEETAEVRHIVGASSHNLGSIVNLSSGQPKVRKEAVSRFSLILSQPSVIAAMNPFEIRCCFCKRVISYPCWYSSKRYAVNHFHYFICFDAADNSKPTTKCYKRG